MARKKRTSGSSVNNATTFSTNTFQSGSDTLVLVFVVNFRAALIGTPDIPEVTGNGLVWQQVQSVLGGTQNSRRMTCFRSMGNAPATGALTIAFGDQTQDLCAWSVFEYDDVATTGVSGAGAVAQSVSANTDGPPLVASLTALADPARNTTVGAIMVELVGNVARPVTPGDPFNEIHEEITSQPLGQAVTLQTQDAIGSSTVGWSWSGTEHAAAIALEVNAAPLAPPPPPPGDPKEALARRFEPVLFLHADEAFLPVDAKRYVENSALWDAVTAFDDKTNWGRTSGVAFPRSPLVPAGQLRGQPTEGGTFIDAPGLLASAPAGERFLELGGWKDTAEGQESAVSSTSTNRYAGITSLWAALPRLLEDVPGSARRRRRTGVDRPQVVTHDH